MPRRQALTKRGRAAFFDLPTDEHSLLQHYTLADDDIEHIHARRLAHNQLGFALQLCVFRYPGRLLIAGKTIPLEVAEYVAAKIGVKAIDLAGYAENEVTPRRITRLRRQGKRYFTDGLKDITSDRRLAILPVCVFEWKAGIADTIVETHYRIVGKTWRDAIISIMSLSNLSLRERR